MGFNISKEGIKLNTNKLQELNNFRPPNDSKTLRQFIGMVNFYRKLIPKFSDLITHRIYLFESKCKATDFNRGRISFFPILKKSLSSITALTFPDSNVKTNQLVTDSLNHAVDAALHQMINEQPVLIGFFTRKLSQTQQRYFHFRL